MQLLHTHITSVYTTVVYQVYVRYLEYTGSATAVLERGKLLDFIVSINSTNTTTTTTSTTTTTTAVVLNRHIHQNYSNLR